MATEVLQCAAPSQASQEEVGNVCGDRDQNSRAQGEVTVSMSPGMTL